MVFWSVLCSSFSKCNVKIFDQSIFYLQLDYTYYIYIFFGIVCLTCNMTIMMKTFTNSWKCCAGNKPIPIVDELKAVSVQHFVMGQSRNSKPLDLIPLPRWGLWGARHLLAFGCASAGCRVEESSVIHIDWKDLDELWGSEPTWLSADPCSQVQVLREMPTSFEFIKNSQTYFFLLRQDETMDSGQGFSDMRFVSPPPSCRSAPPIGASSRCH